MTNFPHDSLFMKGDDRAKTALHGVDSNGYVLDLFLPLPATVLIGFPPAANLSLEDYFGKIVFSVLCSSCFTHGNKAP